MQIKQWIGLSLLVLLAGCSTPKFGNLSDAPNQAQTVMAEDAANKLASVYVPAETRFNVPFPLTGEFDYRLVLNLRQQGFTMFDASAVPINQLPQTGYMLAWALDDVDTENDKATFRLNLYVNTIEFSRLYEKSGKSVQPINGWSRRTDTCLGDCSESLAQ